MRPQTTKQLIQSAFRTLLKAKPLDRITVRDIVEECDLTRNTFYYHYEDIYDLFDDYLDARTHDVICRMPPDSPWGDILLQILHAIFETPQTARHIFFSKKCDTMRLYLQRVIADTIDRSADENGAGLHCAAGDRRLICATCSHALYGLLEEWLTGPDAANFDGNLRRVAQLFEGSIRAALERSAEEREASR